MRRMSTRERVALAVLVAACAIALLCLIGVLVVNLSHEFQAA